MKEQLKKQRRVQTQRRVRHNLHGTAERPRLSVHISTTHVRAQLINDDTATTIASVSTLAQKSVATKTMTEKATWVGEQIAAKAKVAKITTVVFDRGSRTYHGRIKALANAAREAGLTF